MRSVVQLSVVLVLLLLVAGLLAVAVSGVRDTATRLNCQSNVKQVGYALSLHHDFYGHFPTGTVPNAHLDPDRRLSWLTQLYPAFMCGGVALRIDRSKPWDAEGNCPPWQRVRVDTQTGERRDGLVGQLRLFLCPANPSRFQPELPCPTDYVGIAGVGEDAAGLPLSDRRAGLFGYDRKVSRGDMKDGEATTMAVAEVPDGGPWTAGGRATVRGLEAGPPYLGEGGQFAGRHRSGEFFPRSRRPVTNVLFADGSVRSLTPAVSPEVFEALATIAGGEEVRPPD
jgi:prepilin-type processing-associated H-X9-DG protein